MLWSLALLAPVSLIGSDLPRTLAWPLALAAAAWAACDARRYRAIPARLLVIPGGPGAATCDGAPVDDLRVGWRGPLAFLQWREAGGRRQRVSLWPDTLAAGTRRELKIAMLRRDAASGPPTMAG